MESSGYNFLSKFVHKIALGSNAVAETSFDIEKSTFLKRKSNVITDNRHLFVSGLARSGTTALLRGLYETQEFASLTYADMPFVLSPNLWRGLSFIKSGSEYKERAHKDGIYINNDSPEALDEVFWKVFSGNNYILNDRLVKIDLSQEIMVLFGDYIDLILIKNFQGKKIRYLSKNNNNILRINQILKNFPYSKVIIPFRDPMQQSLSLQNQHIHFCKIQKRDPFTLTYMNWIGHHEFGLNQKPFFLGDNSIFNKMLEYDKMDINFWLLTWLNYYKYVLDNYAESCILFSYEQLCNSPDIVLNRLLKKIGVNDFIFKLPAFSSEKRIGVNFDSKILSDCMITYNRLTEMTS